VQEAVEAVAQFGAQVLLTDGSLQRINYSPELRCLLCTHFFIMATGRYHVDSPAHIYVG
jgi:hypothetical protein